MAITALCCGAGCASLFDIPDDPHVEGAAEGVEATPDPPLGASAGSAPGEATPVDAPPSGVDVPTPEVVTLPGASVDEAPETSTSGGGAIDGQSSDAGAPAPDAAVPSEPEPPAPGCAAPETLGPDGACYLLTATPVSWITARQRCRARGAGWDLASLRSAEVNEFTETLGVEQAWIGASDIAAEGNWVWVDDGTAFWRGTGTGAALNGAFESWLGDEPNGGVDSACGRLVTLALGAQLATPAWADFECSELLPFICKGPAR